MSITKPELDAKYQELIEIAGIYPKGYHLRSLANFLKHSERIRNKHDLEFVYENLDAFMTALYDGGPISTIESLELFNKFLYPVGQYYEIKLNFTVFVKPWILCVFIGIACIILAILGAPATIYLAIFSIFFLYYIYLLYKMHKGEIYGVQF